MLALVLASLLTAEDVTQRYDHKGSVGLLVAVTGERKDASSGGSGWKAGVELGGTVAPFDNSNELKLSGRLLFPKDSAALNDFGINLGWRNYFDLGQWKTLFELDVATHITPHFHIGPRLGVGAMYDFLPTMGVYALIGAQIGFGNGARYGAELLLGIQFRSYLLE